MRFLDADEVTARLPWPVVIEALDAAATAPAPRVPRTAVAGAGGELLVMPAATERLVGVKLVGVGYDNAQHGLPRVQGVYVLFDGHTLAPRAVLDGTALTTIRTAGQSAAVVRRLAAPDARTLVVFGTGPQARAHVEAISSVRAIERVRIVGRRAEAAEALAANIPHATAGTPADVADADLVVCATNSVTPVFDGPLLKSGAFVVAIGSHTRDARELDDAVFRRAELVLVEDREAAFREAGDILQALESGALARDRMRDFTDLPELAPTDGILVYKSVGLGYQDLAVVEAALRDERTEPCG